MAKLNLVNGTSLPSLDPTGNMFNTGSALFKWPPVTDAMKNAAMNVVENYTMSETNITTLFENDFAAWHGVKYAFGVSSGTASIHCAMYGVGLGEGDEVIVPAITYWASAAQALNLRASVVFADVEPDTMCLDPDDFERRITPRTKAVVVVHYLGHPADMDRILPIAKKHGIKVIEDVSHAHMSLYKGRLCGTMGDVAGFSCMSAKSFAIGEMGMMITNDKEIYDRAAAFSRHDVHKNITNGELKKYKDIPLGGFKYRPNQICSALGIEMIKIFPDLVKEVDEAMNMFWEYVGDIPGFHPFRASDKWENSTMGGWYCAHAHYAPEELEGLSIDTFCKAVAAEGVTIASPGCNWPLISHPLFTDADVYGEGRPTNRVAPDQNSYPVSSGINARTLYIPWFKKPFEDEIRKYADAYRRVVENYKELLPIDTGHDESHARWMLSPHKV